MLKIIFPKWEGYDSINNLFINTKEQMLQLEHSLVSISKWEMKWLKPFLLKSAKSEEEAKDYIRCMTLTQNVDPNVYMALTPENIQQVNKYIDSPMTATTISNINKSSGDKQILTNEVIYYLMIHYGIPFECQKWHLNRLLTLINVCKIKNEPQQKIPEAELARQYRALNEARRKKYNSRG